METQLTFKYREDRDYFDQLLQTVGGLEQWRILFDFRDPNIKRREFGRIRDGIFAELVATIGSVCQLQCHRDCIMSAEEVDHLIPLSTNVLNKQLSGCRGEPGKKVPSLSYGSNDSKNLLLACSRCNGHKKHRLPSQEIVKRVIRGNMNATDL